jgi:hypothetical protein
MNYTPENEKLDEPIEALIEAMDKFNTVADARIESGNWSTKHHEALVDLQLMFIKLKFNLRVLI